MHTNDQDEPRTPKLRVKECKECHVSFETYTKEKYCSPECRIKYKTKRDSKMQRKIECRECEGKGYDTYDEDCYLCEGRGEIPTIAEMADQAIKCQDACNGIALAGILHRYSRLLMQAYSQGTTEAFQHPVCKLIFMHMTQLMGLPSIFDDYDKTSHACEKLVWEAKKEDYEGVEKCTS